MSRGPAHFTLRLRAFGLPPEHAVRLARQAEQILRERCPGGLAIDPLEFHSSKFSPATEEWSRRARAELRRLAERDRDERQKSRLEHAAELAGEEIDVL